MADDKKREDPRTIAARQRAAALAKAGPGLSWDRFVQFLKDTSSELKKTTWPDRNTLLKSVGIVLLFILATAIWNGGIDIVMGKATQNLFGR
jgi:preprotein translocase SecE subunit